MSLIHRCALGYFAPDSLVIGRRPRVEQPLPREVVEPLRSYLVPINDRPDAWWDEDLLIVEYIIARMLRDRRAFIREVVRATECSVIDILGSGAFKGGKPWSMDQVEELDGW
ncbi:MAG TPA: hypothetical protein VHW23_19450 [Kofleriaceae bacterium]|jgi:hypothetical protein|nr:hypothetical protein [Kofleriaceae bacterium]